MILLGKVVIQRVDSGSLRILLPSFSSMPELSVPPPPKYPPSLLIACDLALRFADALKDDPKLAMSHFRESYAPWLDNRKFAEYLDLIEERYKVRVFDAPKKKTGYYRVTEAGHLLLEQVRSFLDKLGESPPVTVSRYTVGSFVFSTAYMLAPAIGHYFEHREHQQVRISFQDFRNLDTMLRLISRRKLGCAFVADTGRLSMEAYSNELEFRPLVKGGVSPVLVYPLAWGMHPKSPDELANRRLVIPRQFPHKWASLIPHGHADVVTGRVVVTSFVEVLAFVRKGVGYGIMPGVYRDCLDTPDVEAEVGVLQLPAGEPTDYGVIVRLRFDETAPAELREFVSMVTESVNSPGYFSPTRRPRPH